MLLGFTAVKDPDKGIMDKVSRFQFMGRTLRDDRLGLFFLLRPLLQLQERLLKFRPLP